jgi:alanine racemase
LSSPIPTRPCWVEIRTRALEGNFRFLRAVAPDRAELLAIVKADAYGHSLSLCAPAAVRAGARWLGVTTIEEGIAARILCPNAQILVIGGIFAGQGPAILAHRLAVVAWQLDQFDELETAARLAGSAPGSIPIHLEIDTGMTRQGAVPETQVITPLLARFTPGSALRLQAVMTHLFASDETTGTATADQFAQLERAMQIVQASPVRPEFLSVGASAALLGPEAALIAAMAARWGLTPMLRPGLALYGVAPRYQPPFANTPPQLAQALQRLQPVLTWKTRIETLRAIEPGTQIGYNGTFVATEPMRVALLPVGYADGLDRRLGNRFHMLVRGQRAPLVGRISMDQCVLDVTEIPAVQAGDEVAILGAQGDAAITACDHAEAGGTIPWEVFTRIGPRVTRIAV